LGQKVTDLLLLSVPQQPRTLLVALQPGDDQKSGSAAGWQEWADAVLEEFLEKAGKKTAGSAELPERVIPLEKTAAKTLFASLQALAGEPGHCRVIPLERE
jgi:hypothetical protein